MFSIVTRSEGWMWIYIYVILGNSVWHWQTFDIKNIMHKIFMWFIIYTR